MEFYSIPGGRKYMKRVIGFQQSKPKVVGWNSYLPYQYKRTYIILKGFTKTAHPEKNIAYSFKIL
jgi:hypothetical protein